MKIKNYKNYILFGILLAVFVSLLFFGENGLIKYWQIKAEIETTRSQIDSAKIKVRNYEAEIDSLNKSNFKIEKTAREKYNFKKNGEKVIILKETE